MNVSMPTVQSLLDTFVQKHRRKLQTIDFVVGVSRGGLIPAALIATRIDKPLVTAYIDRQDRVYLDRGSWLRGKQVLLVDDIIRTGKTFKKIQTLVSRQKPASIQSFTLFCLFNASIVPTWTTMTKQDNRFPWDRNMV